MLLGWLSHQHKLILDQPSYGPWWSKVVNYRYIGNGVPFWMKPKYDKPCLAQSPHGKSPSCDERAIWWQKQFWFCSSGLYPNSVAALNCISVYLFNNIQLYGIISMILYVNVVNHTTVSNKVLFGFTLSYFTSLVMYSPSYLEQTWERRWLSSVALEKYIC